MRSQVLTKRTGLVSSHGFLSLKNIVGKPTYNFLFRWVQGTKSVE